MAGFFQLAERVVQPERKTRNDVGKPGFLGRFFDPWVIARHGEVPQTDVVGERQLIAGKILRDG